MPDIGVRLSRPGSGLLRLEQALNISEPTLYRECHRIWKAEGIDPYNLLAREEAASEELVSA